VKLIHGKPGIDMSLQEHRVLALRALGKCKSEAEIASVAEELVQYVPNGKGHGPIGKANGDASHNASPEENADQPDDAGPWPHEVDDTDADKADYDYEPEPEVGAGANGSTRGTDLGLGADGGKDTPNEGDAIRFLKALYLDGPWRLTAIDADSGKIETKHCTDIDAAESFIHKWNGKRNLYYALIAGCFLFAASMLGGALLKIGASPLLSLTYLPARC
jgi:hypothetical protein